MNNIALALPSQMPATARAAEITAILAAALLRTPWVQNEGPANNREKQRAVDLGFLPGQRVHTTPYPQEKL